MGPFVSDSSDDDSFTTAKGPTTEDNYEADMADIYDVLLEAKIERVDKADIQYIDKKYKMCLMLRVIKTISKHDNIVLELLTFKITINTSSLINLFDGQVSIT